MKQTPIFVITIVLAVVVVITGLIVWRYSAQQASLTQKDLRPVVVTSTPLLAEFVHEITGENMRIDAVEPPTADPHTFEPNPAQIAALFDADLVVYQSGGISPWMERMIPDLESKNIPVVDVLFGIQDGIPGTEDSLDPHVWMDPLQVLRQVRVIRDAITNIDKARSETYSANAEKYMSALKSLDETIKEELQQCTTREFIVTHNAFRYFERAYGVTMISIAGVNPSDEPTAKELQQMIERIRQQGVTTLFVEPGAGTMYTETIASETGARVQTLNPIEKLDRGAGQTYIKIMQENLQSLLTVCK